MSGGETTNAITESARRAILDALAKAKAMRTAQKVYFRTRQQKSLEEAKTAERELDALLDDAIYAAQTGTCKAKQGSLFEEGDNDGSK